MEKYASLKAAEKAHLLLPEMSGGVRLFTQKIRLKLNHISVYCGGRSNGDF